jgi:gamma-glutamylcyclotransferase (GGCT)/AIG2-like uncharacterized protein YtfP
LRAAQWITELFSEFYIDDTFSETRTLVEYRYEDVFKPLLERRISDRGLPVTEEEVLLLKEFDRLLNYFEHLLYLEEEDHLRKKDRQAIFEYWFDLLSKPRYSAVRRYSAGLGFERVAAALKAESTEHLAFYGSLMTGLDAMDEVEVSDKIEFVGPCRIRGDLYDLGAYPGLVDGDGTVVGELYAIREGCMSVLHRLDRFEHYDPSDQEGSLYVRSCVRLLEPEDTDAWLYVYTQDVSGRQTVSSGDWQRHLAERKRG